MRLFEHFRPEEKGLVERVIEWAEWATIRKQNTLTNFLDPREQLIVQSIVGNTHGAKVNFFGGYSAAERKRALIVPDYVEVSHGDFQVALLSIEGNYKDLSYDHRDVLGSILGLGVKREKFGDILLSLEAQQTIVTTDIAPFVELHLQQISRYQVRTGVVPMDQLVISEEDWKYWQTTLSSLRLDVVLSELLPFSRSKVTPLIKSGKVKVNWRVVENISLNLQEGDTLSIKGYGRYLFSKIEGTTKKQKYIVQLGKKES